MSYNLFLDDKRIPRDCRNYNGDESIYDTEEFIKVSSFEEFYQIIKTKGIPKFVSFDFDLGYNKKNGLDCAKYLKFECDELGVSIPDYNIHSMYPGVTPKFKEILG